MSVGEAFTMAVPPSVDVSADAESTAMNELPFREFNHRMRNQFQLLLSYMYVLEKEGASVHEFTHEIRTFLLSTIALYDSLLIGHRKDNVDLATFVRRIAIMEERRYKKLEPFVRVDIQGDTIEFDAEKSIPLSLIVAELLENAYKTGFPSGAGIIRLHTQIDSADLVVSLTCDECKDWSGPSEEPAPLRDFGDTACEIPLPDFHEELRLAMLSQLRGLYERVDKPPRTEIIRIPLHRIQKGCPSTSA